MFHNLGSLDGALGSWQLQIFVTSFIHHPQIISMIYEMRLDVKSQVWVGATHPHARTFQQTHIEFMTQKVLLYSMKGLVKWFELFGGSESGSVEHLVILTNSHKGCHGSPLPNFRSVFPQTSHMKSNSHFISLISLSEVPVLTDSTKVTWDVSSSQGKTRLMDTHQTTVLLTLNNVNCPCIIIA